MRPLRDILRRPPLAAAAIAGVGAFVLGRITADEEPQRPLAAERCPEPAVTNAAPVEPAPCAVARAPAAPQPAQTATPPRGESVAAVRALSAERVADTEREVAARLEGMIATFQTRCPWSRPAQLTVQVAFDAEGREVGRSFSTDKDAPPEQWIVECLRSLDGVALTVRPPGAPITVSVPLAMR